MFPEGLAILGKTVVFVFFFFTFKCFDIFFGLGCKIYGFSYLREFNSFSMMHCF